MRRSYLIHGPELIVPHRNDKVFIGPGMIRLGDGRIMLIFSYGRAPADFGKTDHEAELPEIYVSDDGGRGWKSLGHMNMKWPLSGMLLGGGISLKYLSDGSLAFLGHRHLNELHGGGIPVFSISRDDGRSWTDARLLSDHDDVYYVMNDRLLELSNGRLIIPTACISTGKRENAYIEGDACDSCCFYSDDSGSSWHLSPGRASLEGDCRGMAEPALAELDDGRLLMLARTGAGSIYSSYSDDGGEYWSSPVRTTLLSPCSSLALKKVPDGRLFVLYNHCHPLKPGAFFPRNPLVYAVSSDGGRTWSEPFCIDDSDGVSGKNSLQHIYPAAFFSREGMLVVYSTHPAPSDGKFSNTPKELRGGIKSALIAT